MRSKYINIFQESNFDIPETLARWMDKCVREPNLTVYNFNIISLEMSRETFDKINESLEYSGFRFERFKQKPLGRLGTFKGVAIKEEALTYGRVRATVGTRSRPGRDVYDNTDYPLALPRSSGGQI